MEKIISAELSILDEIDADTGIGLKLFKAGFDKAKNASSILLYLNSPGGSCFEATGIYAMLTSVRHKLTVHVLGLAASAASILAIAGKKLIMTPNSYLMIHLPYLMGGGRASELRRNADTLDKMTAQYVAIYKQKTGLDEKTLLTMMEQETWLDAREAHRLGFCDEISEGSGQIAAKAFNLGKFGYRSAPTMRAAPTPRTLAEMDARLEADKQWLADRERRKGRERHEDMLALEAKTDKAVARTRTRTVRPLTADEIRAVAAASGQGRAYDPSGCGGSVRAHH